MASSPITSWQIDGETVADFILGGSKITADGNCSHEGIHYVQGKRNPSKMVGAERGHQRADTLKTQSETTSQSDHTDHSLSNSMKLSHAVWGPPRWTSHGGEV